MPRDPKGHLRWRALSVLFCCLHCLAQSAQLNLIDTSLPDAPGIGLPAGQDQSSNNQDKSPGTIRGTVLDPNGNALLGAQVWLSHEGSSAERQVASDADGHFLFNNVAPGAFQLSVIADGFATQHRLGILHPAEALEVPQIALPITAATTEVRVSVTNYELAEEEAKVEETQRVLGVIPNYYVSYKQDALPLRPKQKFELAWKTSMDPVTFAASGAFAGVEQAQNAYKGYGQGARGYAKRYGASYADAFIGIMIGGAILPSLLKQDPRYFYKGTGGTRSRILYALANAVICKGDNGHWQLDYSGLLGGLAAGGISNLYYPASSRDGARLTFENTLISIGGSGASNLLQEFLIRKLTPHAQGKP